MSEELVAEWNRRDDLRDEALADLGHLAAFTMSGKQAIREFGGNHYTRQRPWACPCGHAGVGAEAKQLHEEWALTVG